MASIIERHIGGRQSKIDALWKQVQKTFKWSDTGAVQHDEDNFSAMKCQVDLITAEDINLEASLAGMKRCQGFKNEDAVGNIVLCGNDIATMQVFVLHKGQQMPVHDHPRMMGILKVIKGCVRINSYTFQAYERRKPGDTVLHTKKQTLEVCKGDPAFFLTPTERNFHSIIALNGEAAFLDILSPPYYTNVPGFELNVCNYYREASLEGGSDDNSIVRLVEIPPPEDYWTVKGDYLGPPIEQQLTSQQS